MKDGILHVSRFYEQKSTSIASLPRVIHTALQYVRNIEGKVILDVGCGKGELCYLVSGKGAKTVYGIDITPAAIEYAKSKNGKNNIVYEYGDAQNLKFEKEMFDIVFCTEVIEHIADYEKCIREIFRVLKKGGECVISLPNYFNIMFWRKQRGDLKLLSQKSKGCRLGWSPFGPQPIETYFNPYLTD